MIGLIVIGAAGYWGYNQYNEKQQLEVYLGNKYQQAFYEMVDRIEQVQVLLGKTLVSTSPRQNIMILTDIWSNANIAQQELTKLPLSAQNVYKTSKFLSQAGDYAHVMARQNASGEVMTEDNRKTINQLRQHASEIITSLHNVESKAFSGNVNWVELVKGVSKRTEQQSPKTPVSDGFDNVSEEIEKVPSLIYDGPFSDQVLEAKPKEIKGGKITKDDAKKKARQVVDFKNQQDVNISEGTTVKGKIPSFNFQLKNNNEGTYSVSLTQEGGHVLNIINNRQVNNATLDQSGAADRARDYLGKNGYPNMEPTYSEINQNIAYISFAYKPKDIIYYKDIINVQVALDNGQILGVNAINYLMSHHQRSPEKPKLTTEEAKKLADNTLDTIQNVQLAVIPKSGNKEVFTYEIRGNAGNETYLIYINAQTGDEEQILKVVKGQNGTFVL